MLNGADGDGRVRGTMQFHGAHTGRWAGRRIQPQNLPRPTRSQDEIEKAIELLQLDDVDAIREMGEPLHVLADTLRSLIKAKDGYEFVAVDFSSIEARVLAWLAREEAPLDVFRDGGDIYLHAASNIYNREITKDDKDERQIGKVATLALGYAGGVGAFQQMAKGYGVKVSDHRANKIKQAWREAHPSIVGFWNALETAAIAATDNPREVISANRYVSYRRSGSFLQCRLPSGRKISYPYPKTELCGYYMEDDRVRQVREKNLRTDEKFLSMEKTWEKPTLFHMHRHQAAFVLRGTYGGSLCENVVQAVARDLLVEAMQRFEALGHKIVMHVHDEVVLEVKEGTLDVAEAERIMSVVPAWAKGCPIDAEGWSGRRYRK